MTPNPFNRRLAALEAARIVTPVRFTPEELEDAARRYVASLRKDATKTPQATRYFATATLHQLASDYDAMLKGASAPWE